MLGGVGSDSGDCQQPMVMVMCYAAASKELPILIF
jgi:hypothetical protein